MAAPTGANPPVDFYEGYLGITRKLEAPRSSNVHVEIMKIPLGATIDPPPDAKNFERFSAIKIAINADYFPKRLGAALRQLNAASWTKSNAEVAKSRLRVRFMGPWNEVLLEMFVIDDKAIIIFEGVWYKVSGDAVSSFANVLYSCVVDTWMNKDLSVPENW